MLLISVLRIYYYKQENAKYTPVERGLFYSKMLRNIEKQKLL